MCGFELLRGPHEIEEVFDLAFALAQYGGILQHKSTNELLVEAILVYEELCECLDSRILILVVEEKTWFLSRYEALLLLSEAICLTQVPSALADLASAHI